MKETCNKQTLPTRFLISFLMGGVYPQRQMQSFKMYINKHLPAENM